MISNSIDHLSNSLVQLQQDFKTLLNGTRDANFQRDEFQRKWDTNWDNVINTNVQLASGFKNMSDRMGRHNVQNIAVEDEEHGVNLTIASEKLQYKMNRNVSTVKKAWQEYRFDFVNRQIRIA